MKNRSILLAIGVAASLLSFWAGSRVDVGFHKIRQDHAVQRAPGFVVGDNGAKLERVRLAGMVREVTAYNVGVPEQTSETPCIGASGKNLCSLVEAGRKICAANFVKLGTVLHIDNYGECVVLDRMHRRFGHRVDIAMRQDAVDEAVEFGLQKRVVAVKN